MFLSHQNLIFNADSHIVETLGELRHGWHINTWFYGNNHSSLQLFSAIGIRRFVQIYANGMAQKMGVKHSLQVARMQPKTELVEFDSEKLT